MVSPSSIAANLSCLLYLVRHRADRGDEIREAIRVFRGSLGDQDVVLTATSGWLTINGERVPSSSPGVRDVNELLLSHQVQQLVWPAGVASADVTAVVSTLASYPGTYADWQAMLTALGPAAERVRLQQGGPDLALVHFPDSYTPLVPGQDFGVLAALQSQPFLNEGGLIPPPLPAAEPRGAPPLDRPTAPVRENPSILSGLVKRGRSAVDAGDMVALLRVGQEFLQAEASAQGEASARIYRLEMRRLFSRRELKELARLAAVGQHREAATAVLRGVGGVATDILMDLLAETEAMAERRGYYSAITRMEEGTEIIVHHLTHPAWFVVRNAADLCGEMGLVQAVPVLAQQVSHEDERVRKAVAAALRRIGTPDTVEPLARMLKDPSPAIRMQVIGNLDGDRDRALAMPLVTQLRTEESPDVIREILRALGRIGTPDALMALRGVALGEGKRLHRRHRVQAVEALGLAGAAARAILGGLSNDSDREVAAAAGQALATIPV
jgi:HEAT repeat protein